MAREKTLELGGVNVSMHNHKNGSYLELFNFVGHKPKEIQIRGTSFGLITVLDADKTEFTDRIIGAIWKYTKIDGNSSWINTQTITAVPPTDIDDLGIPENLSPNLKIIPFAFFPKHHIFVYQSYNSGVSITPLTVEKFLENLFKQKEVKNKFGSINVTHLPQVESVDAALGLPYLEKIDLCIKRPNPDDLASMEAKIAKRLEHLSVDVHEQTFKAAENQTIRVDSELDMLARVAARNGKLTVKGKDVDGKNVNLSTSSHPLKEKFLFLPENFKGVDVFQHFAESFYNTYKKIFQ